MGYGGEVGVEDAALLSDLAKGESDVGDLGRVGLDNIDGGVVCQVILAVVIGEDAEHDLGAVRAVLDAALGKEGNGLAHGGLPPNDVVASKDQRGVTFLHWKQHCQCPGPQRSA